MSEGSNGTPDSDVSSDMPAPDPSRARRRGADGAHPFVAETDDAVAAFAAKVGRTYRPSTPMTRSAELASFTRHGVPLAGAAPAPTRRPRRARVAAVVAAFVATLTGKLVLGGAVATAAIGGLHWADVVDVPLLPDGPTIDAPAENDEPNPDSSTPPAATDEPDDDGEDTDGEDGVETDPTPPQRPETPATSQPRPDGPPDQRPSTPASTRPDVPGQDGLDRTPGGRPGDDDSTPSVGARPDTPADRDRPSEPRGVHDGTGRPGTDGEDDEGEEDRRGRNAARGAGVALSEIPGE